MKQKGNLTPAGQILSGKLGHKAKTPGGMWESMGTPTTLRKGTKLKDGWTPKGLPSG